MDKLKFAMELPPMSDAEHEAVMNALREAFTEVFGAENITIWRGPRTPAKTKKARRGGK